MTTNDYDYYVLYKVGISVFTGCQRKKIKGRICANRKAAGRVADAYCVAD
jgi:hypothetical protein